MRVLCLLFLALGAWAAELVDPKDCTAFPCLIFNDEFDYLDHNVWEHEVNMAGGGNWEFQVYVNNRSVSYTQDSKLFIKPGLTSEWYDEAFLSSGFLDLWGMNGRGDVCTGNGWYGCERYGTAQNIINPAMSGRLRTQKDFSFTYGRVEVRAKLPKGDWLWPAIWMQPAKWPYGKWPASGEIDIVESRGNSDYGNLGHQYGASTLHWGPFWSENRYTMTHAEYAANDGSFAGSFHTFRVDWTKDNIQFYVDDALQLAADPGTNFWDYGGWGDQYDNPWRAGTKMSPFDQDFYLILCLAVGGTNGYFPDEVAANPPKPWSNTSPESFAEFWNGRNSWLPTWQDSTGKISDDAAMQVDYVKVWKMESVEQ